MDRETLVKLPVTKLKEEALKIEGLNGVHGMKKNELLQVLFDHYGIKEVLVPKKDTVALKAALENLRAKKKEVKAAGDKKAVEILRRRIHAAKRRTRP